MGNPGSGKVFDAWSKAWADMTETKLFEKGRQLIEMYKHMAANGYDRVDGSHVEVAYNSFEIRKFRTKLRPLFAEHGIETLLDYGSGGADWEGAGFDTDTGLSAKAYFGLTDVIRYEPARDIDERRPADCVVNFDVLEHVFISDIPMVTRELFSYAGKLIIVNVAGYEAAAKLPNGKNAHVTVRPPMWWKGLFDCISIEFPDVSICLICSTSPEKATMFPIWRADDGFEV